jgi:PIN domain nuclease of toxin-antitoxin system
LDFPRSLEQQLLQNQFHPLPISIPHAMAVATLPLHHRDPFGRMLVAQARIESLTLVTSDPILRAYDVTTLLV